MKKIFLFFCLIMSILLLSSCGKQYECEDCTKKTSKVYYDYHGNSYLCEECARQEWAPFDYKIHRVK